MPENNTQDLSFDEFERALDEFLEREAEGFDELPASTFFELMAKIEQERMENPIELEAEITDGNIHFALSNDAETSVTTRQNEIIVEGRRILVRLKSLLPVAG
jgi:hypothetical protein